MKQILDRGKIFDFREGAYTGIRLILTCYNTNQESYRVEVQLIVPKYINNPIVDNHLHLEAKINLKSN